MLLPTLLALWIQQKVYVGASEPSKDAIAVCFLLPQG